MSALAIALLIGSIVVLTAELCSEYTLTPAWLFFGSVLALPFSFLLLAVSIGGAA